MTRFLLSGAALAGGWLAVLATPAAAQVAGLYKGTSADGNSVSFTVANDPATNVLAVTSAGVFFTAPCAGTASPLSKGWGYGLTADVSNRKVSNVTSGAYFDIAFNLVFSADGQTATGSVTSISPELQPGVPVPRKAYLCKSPKQTMSVTLQPPAMVAATAARPVGYSYDRMGRIIGVVSQ